MVTSAADREYWERELAGRDYAGTAFPDLPAEPPPAAGGGARYEFELRRETADRLLALANGSDLALFTLLLAGLRQLLARYTGQTRIAVGAPIFATEFDPDARNTLLVLAGEVRRGETFAEVLRREREIVLGAKKHQGFPVAGALAALGAASGAERFGVLLRLANIQHPRYAADERAGMVFDFEREDRAIRGRVEFDPARYRESFVMQIAGHLDALLLAAASHPKVPVAGVDLLSPEERARSLGPYARSAEVAPITTTIVTEFAAQVALGPERIALRGGGETLTYAELARRAERVARRLRAAGLGAEEPVGLFLSRSIAAVVGMLGVLQAGGCYLPLDPAYPAARNRFMVEDAGARIVLARGAPPEGDQLGAAVWLDLDDEREPADTDDRPVGSFEADPASIAYVLYTSGSTGKPKGVPIPHRGVVQLAKRTDFFQMSPAETFLLQSTLTFDASVFEIWCALLNGAALVVAPAVQPSLDDLAETIRISGADTILLTAALFHLMVDERRAILRSVRQLIVGGDVMSARHARDLLKDFSGRLCNGYGPTENSVVSTAHPMTTSEPLHGSVPLGRPIGATEVFILDEAGRSVPEGVSGEIHLGGPGLARGYLRWPALTAERFVPHPFGAEPGARLYRTGDLGRFLPGGTIEFLGRADGQVKIRGFRIEPGEVESLLCEHPAVSAAAVVAQADNGGAKRLLAFVVPLAGQAATGGDLREFLRTRTPAHQVPAEIYFRAELPLNASGKIDRRRLLELAGDQAPAAAKELPRTPVEHAVAAIWRQVLNRSDIGIREDFFDIGGDSLRAMQVLARINKSGLRLPAKQFFREPTIAAVAAAAVPATKKSGETHWQGPVALTPVQCWFFEEHPVDVDHFNLSGMFDVRGEVDPADLARAIGAVVRHHDAFHLAYGRDGAGWSARYVPPRAEPPFTVVDLTGLPEEAQLPELERQAQACQESLKLAQAELIRFVYFRRGGGGRDRLLAVVHHLTIDAISWRIVLDDLQTALEQLRERQPLQLPPGSDAFGVWANRLPEYLRSEAATAGRAYWLKVAPALAGMRHDGRDEAPVDGRIIASHQFSVEETARLLQVPVAAKATMEELLLAALLVNYCKQRGEKRMGVMLDRHGRTERIGGLDISRTVGWFTAFAPVYLRLEGEPTFAAAFATAVATQRQIPNRGVDYSMLRYLGTPEERAQMATLPGPDAQLNYQGEFDLELGRTGMLALSLDGFGEQQSPRHRRMHALEIDVSVVDAKMGLLCAADSTRYGDGRAARLIEGIAATLLTLPDHFRSEGRRVTVEVAASTQAGGPTAIRAEAEEVNRS